MKTFLKILRDAVIACAIFAVAGLIINAVRPDGLPFIADKPYDIFVPCPEILGEVDTIPAGDPRILEESSLVIDARSAEEFAAWHLENAMNITYDYLDPISPDELKNISANIIKSGKARLVVYGDGDGLSGSTGYQLGSELAGNGIKNIYIVEGGVDALISAHKKD